jgi:hypothetical protein
VGLRRETYLHDPAPVELAEGDLDWRVIHGEIDTTLAVGDHSFELRLEHRFERRFLGVGYVEYERGGATLTWSVAGELLITPTLLWNSEKRELATFYPGGEVRWNFIEGSFVRVFGGRTPGGRLCSGGICRDVPAFEGVLSEIVVRI